MLGLVTAILERLALGVGKGLNTDGLHQPVLASVAFHLGKL